MYVAIKTETGHVYIALNNQNTVENIIEETNKNIPEANIQYMLCPTVQFRARNFQYHAPTQKRHAPLCKVERRVHTA